MNSRNSPVSRNPTCSPMSTALSPDPLQRARGHVHVHPPVERCADRRRASAPRGACSGSAGRPGRPSSGASGRARGRGGRTPPSRCGASRTTMSPISASCWTHRLAARQVLRSPGRASRRSRPGRRCAPGAGSCAGSPRSAEGRRRPATAARAARGRPGRCSRYSLSISSSPSITACAMSRRRARRRASTACCTAIAGELAHA